MMHRVSEVRDRLEQSIAVKRALLADEALLGQVSELAESCVASLSGGGKVIFAGNGGSFADAQHLSAEFTSRLMLDRAPLASIALGTNSSSMSAIANDYAFDQIFARELRALGMRGDVFVPITTSGNSPNILAAVPAARTIGMRTVALTGESGGKLKELCECIRVPSTVVARIQECHITIGHVVCEFVEARLFGSSVSHV